VEELVVVENLVQEVVEQVDIKQQQVFQFPVVQH
jgi:hypothetical protein|tara:strand:- start:392 stop:493 length:102 start_codon:yes stop_codon:yes gene_type:complete